MYKLVAARVRVYYPTKGKEISIIDLPANFRHLEDRCL